MYGWKFSSRTNMSFYPCPYPMCGVGAKCTFGFKLAGDRSDKLDIGFFDNEWRLPDDYWKKTGDRDEVLEEAGRSFNRRARLHVINKHGFAGIPWDNKDECYDATFDSISEVSIQNQCDVAIIRRLGWSY